MLFHCKGGWPQEEGWEVEESSSLEILERRHGHEQLWAGLGWEGTEAVPAPPAEPSRGDTCDPPPQLLGKALQRNVRLETGNEKNSWEGAFMALINLLMGKPNLAAGDKA